MPANNRPRPGRDLRERISARGSLSLAASANYVINEWLDAAYDKFHPEKRVHYCVSGQIAGRGVTLEYILLVPASPELGLAVSWWFVLFILLLLGQGILYNVLPLRLKDLPYLAVLFS